MKTWTIMLTASFLVAAIPFVTAESTGCSRAGPTEAMAHPAKANAYLFFDLTQDGKVGEWEERNGSPGLQTVKCFAASGAIKWGSDRQVKVLG